MPTLQRPYISIDAPEQMCHSGWPDIGQALKEHLQRYQKKKLVLTVECYPGTYAGLDLLALKKALAPDVICQSDDLFLDEPALRKAIPVPDPMAEGAQLPKSQDVEVLFDQEKLRALRQTIEQLPRGLVLVHGVGAHHVWPSDLLVYSDVSRWELLQRMRRQELGNIGFANKHISLAQRITRAYFLDWPLAEQIKQDMLPECHFYLEANNWQQPNLITGDIMRAGLAQASRHPLFMAPFFDPEIWTATDSIPKTPITTSFDLHPNTDNFLLKACHQLIEIPVRNILYLFPEATVGEKKGAAIPSVFPFTLTHHTQLQKKEHLIFWHPGPAELPDVSLHQHLIVLAARPQATLLAGFHKNISLVQKKHILQQDVPRQFDWLEHLQQFPVDRFDCLSFPQSMLHSTGSLADVLRISRIDEHWRQRIPQRLQDEAKITCPPEQAALSDTYAGNPEKWTVGGQQSPVDQLCVMQHNLAQPPASIPHAGSFRVVCHLRGSDVLLDRGAAAPTRLHAGQLVVLPAAYQNAAWRSEGQAELLMILDR